MNATRRRMVWLSQLVVGAALALQLGVASAADAYPARPIRLIVPFPPGGATDSIARLVAQKMSHDLKQQVVVDNKPGGGTIIATDIAAKAPADGYTLLVVTAAYAVNPSLYRQLPYNPDKDLQPVSLVSSAPNVLVVHPQLPVSSVSELIRYAKAHPHEINFASAGNGTSNHIAGEMLRSMAGIDMVHVPYKGDAPSITDLLAGRVQMLFIGLGPVAQYIKSGALKAIAVSSAKPTALAPGLPTVASALPGFESAVWNGIMVPAGTPGDVVDRLQSEIAHVLAEPDTRAKLAALGFDPVGDKPTAFAAYLKTEAERSARVVREAGIQAQ